jgi:MoaA/NifB/PqqE/SkfB family radical SAM enzyme
MSARLRFDRAPLRVYWEMTRACDLACQHCRAEAAPEPDPAELTTAEGLRLLERMAAFGSPFPHVIFTGGDPLKRADLFALIARARALALGVSVAPSATPQLTPQAIRRLCASGVEAISLSLDGSTAERHDALESLLPRHGGAREHSAPHFPRVVRPAAPVGRRRSA